MVSYKSREVESVEFMGERVDFIASNERIRERVGNMSHESYVLETLIERGRADDVFWDVGACLGIHSFVLAKHLWDGDVMAFEPMPSNRGVLSDNKSVNEIENVRVFREAMADEVGERTFSIRESVQAGYGRHSFSTGEYEAVKEIPVPVTTGDALVASGAAPVPNMIKIDVEGAGPLVLEGLTEVLQRDECHTVIVETHEPNPVQPSHEDYGYTEEEFLALLEETGFSVSQMEEPWHFMGAKDVNHTASVDASCEFELVQGDISTEESDMIVNSAGTTLRMGTGVAGALRSAGGEELNQAAIVSGPAEVGECVVTDGFELDAEYVAHAVSMPHYGSGQSTPESITESVRGALEAGEERECRSVSVPMVGCGLGGVSLATGARAIRDVVSDFEFEVIETVRVVVYTEDEYSVVERVMA